MNTRSSVRLALRSSSIEFQNQTSRGSARRNKPMIVSSDSDSEEQQPNYTNIDIDSKKKRYLSRRTKVNSISSESEGEHPVPKQVELLKTPRKNKATDKHLEEESPVTPPKQRRSQESNFSTPNHNRNVATNLGTPSSLLRKLVLTSPDKNSISSNRKSLFPEDDTVKKDSKKDVYQNARRALHSTAPTDMPGREKELEELRIFIDDHLSNKRSGSMYISGPPGTGKTASLNLILKDENIVSDFRQVYVNCTAIKSPNAIYSRIAKELNVKINGRGEKDYLSGLENYLKSNHKMLILVLDEIDQLESKNQSILYTIFEWPSKTNSRLILIGIANALDLTDRTLPRLQARCELKPKLMHFAPYTKEEIVKIFKARLEHAGVLDVFSPIALQMLAGKVASMSGDVRRALDIGRRVIELVDQSRKDKNVKSIEHLANELVNDGAKSVEMKEVLTVLNKVYGTSQNLVEDDEEAFPLQQKIIICSLLLILKKAKNKDVTVGKLHEVYRKVCQKRNLLAVDQAEFVGLCSLIETRGIIRVSGRKEPRLNKVNLEWNEEEVSSALGDKQLMSMILQDDSCLGKI